MTLALSSSTATVKTQPVTLAVHVNWRLGNSHCLSGVAGYASLCEVPIRSATLGSPAGVQARPGR